MDGDLWLKSSKALAADAVNRLRAIQNNIAGISIEVEPVVADLNQRTFTFVDGGSTAIDLLGGTVYFARAAAAFFDAPRQPEWSVKADSGLTTLPRDTDRYVSIVRDTMEVNAAFGQLERNPEYVVLDNSLATYATTGIPHSVIAYFTPKGSPDSSPEYEYFEAFVSFMEAFDSLIKECLRRGTTLVGAAKDPRSRSLGRSLGMNVGLMDRTLVALAAGDKTGFTRPMKAGYLKEPRVVDYLEDHEILTEGRGDFETLYGVLAPRAPVFRVDYLSAQRDRLDDIRRFVASLHDGRGYLLPSHLVHDRATIPAELAASLLKLVKAVVAKEDMLSAEKIFGNLRRQRFG